MKKKVIIALFGAMLCSSFSLPPVFAAPAAAAADGWKAEFDAVCGQTDNATEMTVAELKKAIERCDALQPQIEALEATPRKVYLKRLQMCRSLFAYMLEAKAKENK